MPSEPRTGQQLYHGDALAPVTATKVVATAILAIYALQIGLYSAGVLELVAALVSDVAVLVGLFLYVRTRGLRLSHLGLRRPAGVFVLAGALVGVSAWYLNLALVVLIDPPGETTALQTVVEQTPLVSTLLAIALLPAIVEEIVFRGVFVRALATRFVPAAAIVLASLVFAIYHLLPPQMVSTFGLGLALAYLTLRADSALPAMVAHLLNNTIAILIARDTLPGVGTWMAANTPAMLAITVTLLGGGLALAARGPLRQPRGP